MKIKVLIVSGQPQRFLDELDLARSLVKHSSSMSVCFFISDNVYHKYYDIIENMEFNVVNNLNIKCKTRRKNINLNLNMKKIFFSLVPFGLKNKIIDLIKYIRSSKFYTKKLFSQEDEIISKLYDSYLFAKDIVSKHDFNVMFVNGDRHLGIEPVFLKISKELNITSIIPYLVDYSDEERIFFNNPETKYVTPDLFISNYVKKSQKEFIHTSARGYYYYRHPVASALKKFGVLTSDPFVMGKGKSDILCLNNNYYADQYIEKGVDERKIKVVGDISYDTLYQAYIKKNDIVSMVISKYHLDRKKKTVIIALPQLGEHHILPWDRHWEEVRFILSSVSKLEVNVLVSLHPRMIRSDYQFIELEFGCHILEERLANVIVVADLFVATYSSTVVWAVLCGINSAVLDFYDLGYNMYDFLNSIIKIKDKQYLIKGLKSGLIDHRDFSEDWFNLSKEDVFDGNTISRYVNLISEVSSK
ncbi:hypothetical protein MHN79_09135 [Vibrio sp. Of14-4]|uniref:hypothetical protein n=1 Tax=Vibrio sp. Of14-4 TaxID=2724878 RepID=UPI001EF26E42|nr:hypothetical protein [Vibrio sp. Of14-4]MCG7489655.1 hypothetical protein [Vibrio sp. Of14-4]